ncbi:hypothetical protein CSUB01_11399 [Colletotrichum sublineola]|uniref:Transmembrane protein n=1 Tax=Colletotrichum sublineola TaxID=1173701 RepID=A0A066XQ26_COLSU|nr:hypothetical protein CSUB01_11399 [Colletotrichum sublineola]
MDISLERLLSILSLGTDTESSHHTYILPLPPQLISAPAASRHTSFWILAPAKSKILHVVVIVVVVVVVIIFIAAARLPFTTTITAS